MGLILLVSEDLVEIETVKAALSVHGWWVTVAGDRQTALQVAADQAPKMVLVDYDLPDAIELLRSFGSVNGGPGVVALVGEDFDGALELKEAGADELLTKPGSLPTVLEAVQRCLAAPRPGLGQRRVPSNRLLTTEEIFGDVLREIGEQEAPRAPAEATLEAAAAPSSPSPGEVFETAPAAGRLASLAGLFDDPPAAPEAPAAAAPAQPEPAESPEPTGDDWRGEERRSVDRPWSGARGQAEGPAAAAADEADTVVTSISAIHSEPAPPTEAPVEIEEIEAVEEFEAAAPPPEAETTRDRRLQRPALVSGALAALLLVAAGVVFVLDPGSEPAGGPPPPVAEPEAPPPSAPPAVEPPAVAAASPEGSSSASEEAAQPIEEIEEVDIEAIVNEELERREEMLRRVFLEEEKRLLRELNNLDSSEPTGDAGADGDAGEPAGAGG